MSYSSIFTDYLAQGDSASLPGTVSIAPTALSIYYDNTNEVVHLWNTSTGTFDTLAAGGGGVSAVVAGTGLEVGAGPGGTITSTGTLNLTAATTAALGGVLIGAGLGISSGTISNSGVLAVGATAGSIVLGPNLSMSGQTLEVSTGAGGVTKVVAGTGLEVGSGPGGTITGTGTLNIIPATTAVLGGIIAGSGVTINAGGTISVAPGGVTSIGGDTGSITIGTGLQESSNTLSNVGVIQFGTDTGTIHVGTGLTEASSTLSLNAATTAALGGVIVGSGLSVTSGTISNAGTGTVSAVVAGAGLEVGAGPGGTITGSGTLNVIAATTAALGGITIPATGVIVSNGTTVLDATLLGLTLTSGTLEPNTAARVLINSGTVAAAGSSSIASDWSAGNIFTNTMTANATLANPSNVSVGETCIYIINAGTTGTLTLAYGSDFVFNSPYSNASPPAIGAGVNILTCVSSGTAVIHSVLQPGTWA